MSPPFLPQRWDEPIGSWADWFRDEVRRRGARGWRPTNLEPIARRPEKSSRRGDDAEEEIMSQLPEDLEAPQPPRGHVRVVYLGPVAPHWEVQSDFGDRALIEEFRQRTLARLVLLPPHDPQFRRNRERVVRDAERENLLLDWDLGIPDEMDEQA
jgi:hypothetical protein